MDIVIVTGTCHDGVTKHLRDLFVAGLSADVKVTSFRLPLDGPGFCTGCKTCFTVDERKCPHAASVQPIWQAMAAADVIVFFYPAYVMRAPGQVKALLDHLGYRWLVHRPDPAMFSKRALIVTQALGAGVGPAAADVRTSLNWLGISAVRTHRLRLLGDVSWHKLSEKRRQRFERDMNALAADCSAVRPAGLSLATRAKLMLCRQMQKRLAKTLAETSLDVRYWREHNWLVRSSYLNK